MMHGQKNIKLKKIYIVVFFDCYSLVIDLL